MDFVFGAECPIRNEPPNRGEKVPHHCAKRKTTSYDNEKTVKSFWSQLDEHPINVARTEVFVRCHGRIESKLGVT